jgi:flagellar export protein FliJ
VKRFIFRLDKVLQVKEQRQRLAELRQQQARLAVDKVRAEIATLTGQLQAASSALETQIGRSVEAGAWTGCYEHSTRVGNALRAAEAMLMNALAELETASSLRTKITQEVEALLTLREQQWHAHRDEAAAQQQDQLDELALSRWQAARRLGPRAGQPR